jgi:hypothetical protein
MAIERPFAYGFSLRGDVSCPAIAARLAQLRPERKCGAPSCSRSWPAPGLCSASRGCSARGIVQVLSCVWFNPPRALPFKRRRRRARERHALQVGEIIFAWNELQSALFGLFWGLTETNGPKSNEIALAIWHSFQSERAQRDMLLSVARAQLPPTSRSLTSIRWLVRAADDLGLLRNVPLIHRF